MTVGELAAHRKHKAVQMSEEDREVLEALREAAAEALDRKRRLGQYAVAWRNGRPGFSV